MLKDMLQGSRWDCASLYKSTSDNPRLNEAKVLGLWLCWSQDLGMTSTNAGSHLNKRRSAAAQSGR